MAPSRSENSASRPHQYDPGRQNTNRRCSPPTAIYAHSFLRFQISSCLQPVSLRSLVRWQLHGIHGDGSTHVPGRDSPAARWSLELAEKVSNYLNICRIHKSSRSPARPQVSSDANRPLERCTRGLRPSRSGMPHFSPPLREVGTTPARASHSNCTSHCKYLRTARSRRIRPPATPSPYSLNSLDTDRRSGITIAPLLPSLLEHLMSSIPPPAPPRLKSICACKLRTFL